MIRRGDEGVKDLWEEVQLEDEIAKEEQTQTQTDPKEEEEEKEDTSKKFTPSYGEEDDEVDEDDPTVFTG